MFDERDLDSPSQFVDVGRAWLARAVGALVKLYDSCWSQHRYGCGCFNWYKSFLVTPALDNLEIETTPDVILNAAAVDDIDVARWSSSFS